VVAHDEELRREVALKRMQGPCADDPEHRRRFLGEAEITGRLEHPGIVPVYGLVQGEDGRPCYAMRFIQGETLQEALQRFHAASPAADPGARRLALRQLLTRFVAVCNAVAYAHSQGVWCIATSSRRTSCWASTAKHCIKVSADPRLRNPDLLEFRKALLLSAARFYEEFVRQQSDDPGVRAGQGSIYVRLGCLKQTAGSRSEAEELFQQALQRFDELARRYPAVIDYQNNLAFTLSMLGALYQATGRPAEAEAAYRRAREIVGPLTDAHLDAADFRNNLAATQFQLGSLYQDTDRPAEAEAAYRRAREGFDRLVRAHPAVTAYRTALAGTDSSLGHLYLIAGRGKEAEGPLRRAVDLLEPLARARPDRGGPQAGKPDLRRAGSDLGRFFPQPGEEPVQGVGPPQRGPLGGAGPVPGVRARERRGQPAAGHGLP
jgi:tetratricopeptide (TPR) repeat protein